MLKLDHIAIHAVNLEQSILFYRDFLGLTYVNQIDMGDHNLTYFSLGGSCSLELIYHSTPNAEKEGAVSNNHIALTTQNIEEFRERCAQYRVDISMEPTHIEKLQSIRMLIRDCNGVELEIIQYIQNQPSVMG